MRIGRLADRTIGRHRAPRDPAVAVEEARQPHRVLHEVVVHFDPEDLWAGFECEGEIALAAHVHAGDAVHGRQRARQQVDRRFAVERRVVTPPRHQGRFVEEEHESGAGQTGVDQRFEGDRPRSRDCRGALEGAGCRHPGRVECGAERQRPCHLGLDACRHALGARRQVEEREQAGVRTIVEDAFGRRVGLAEHGERSVGRDLDLREGHQPLRQHPLARITPRELRDRGQLGEAPEHQLGRGRRIVVGQTPDAGRDSGYEHRCPEGRRHGAVLYDRLDGVLQAGARRTHRSRSSLDGPDRTESRCLALSSCGCCASRGSPCR